MKLATALTGLVAVLAATWLGFVVHISPRFAGSGTGVAVGIGGASLMVGALAYVLPRRIPRVRRWFPLARMLSIHVVCGVVGPLLAIVHTGHRFERPLGVALVTAVLLVVATGYAGHVVLRKLSHHRGELAAMQPALRDRLRREAAGPPSRATRRLAAAIADVELATAGSARLETWLRRWRVLHVALTVVLFALLGVHVWAAFYFGVRW